MNIKRMRRCFICCFILTELDQICVAAEQCLFVAGFVAAFEGKEVGGEEDVDTLARVVVTERSQGDAVFELVVPASEAITFPLQGFTGKGFVAGGGLGGDGSKEIVDVDSSIAV